MPRPHSHGILQSPTDHLVHQNGYSKLEAWKDLGQISMRRAQLAAAKYCAPKGPITTRCSEV